MVDDIAVREAVADTLKAVPDLRTHAFTPGQVNPPALVVIESDIEFDQSMQRGSERMVVLCRLLAGGDLRTAQQKLSSLVYQIRDVLWDDPDLGGVVSDSRLARKRGDSEGQIEVAGGTFAVVDVEIEVIT